MPVELMSLVQDDDVRAQTLMLKDKPAYYVDIAGTVMLADGVVTDENIYAEYKAAGVKFLADKVPSDTLIHICKIDEHPAEINPLTDMPRMSEVLAQMKMNDFTLEQQETVLIGIQKGLRKCYKPAFNASAKKGPAPQSHL